MHRINVLIVKAQIKCIMCIQQMIMGRIQVNASCKLII